MFFLWFQTLNKVSVIVLKRFQIDFGSTVEGVRQYAAHVLVHVHFLLAEMTITLDSPSSWCIALECASFVEDPLQQQWYHFFCIAAAIIRGHPSMNMLYRPALFILSFAAPSSLDSIKIAPTIIYFPRKGTSHAFAKWSVNSLFIYSSRGRGNTRIQTRMGN